MNEDQKKSIQEKFADITKFDQSLAKYCTFRIGGIASALITVRTDRRLKEIFSFLVKNNIPYFILGGGSNVLFADKYFRGVVVNLKNNQCLVEDNIVKVGAGLPLAALAGRAAVAGLSGLEWSLAVPGTVGGAIRGNAGCFGSEIKDKLIKATVFDGEKEYVLTPKDLDFAYRSSRIKNNQGKEIVINAEFELEKDETVNVVGRQRDLLMMKIESQPLGKPTAGCMFKNIEVDPQTKRLINLDQGNPTELFFKAVPENFWDKGSVPAGWIIDSLGLKGHTQNGMKISEKHANFLMNDGNASGNDALGIIEFIKNRVLDQYGVLLQEEVQIVNYFE